MNEQIFLFIIDFDFEKALPLHNLITCDIICEYHGQL